MGLNVAWPPEPTDLAISASSVAGRPIGRDELLAAYLDHLDRRLTQWEEAPAGLHADYRAALGHDRSRRAGGAGRRARSRAPPSMSPPDGQLVVVSDGTQHQVSAADVVHLRGSVT